MEGDDIKAVLESSLDRIAARLALLEKLPYEDPYENGTVLIIERTFGLSKVYTYAALKTVDQWWLTGEKHFRYRSERSSEIVDSGVPWVRLRAWLIESGDPRQLSIVRMDASQKLV